MEQGDKTLKVITPHYATTLDCTTGASRVVKGDYQAVRQDIVSNDGSRGEFCIVSGGKDELLVCIELWLLVLS